jgi:hypothetical protein
MELNYFVLCISWGLQKANLHATRQGIHSPAGELVATKFATHVKSGNWKAGQSATGSFDILNTNWRIVAICQKPLTDHINLHWANLQVG